ncbi:AI-2E family transporter [Conservatibacter flavescens]|uniref:AI-2E family transporter n=1 Tax=Conservatibacter flavescens TaxID=28161 RepID=A0A2M8S3B1_9PAST|nr:AI-2E family transporter [Conservatibacter flavescens]PJG85631.1 AI-2E family transporter [Conservatibacter flavescens]
MFEMIKAWYQRRFSDPQAMGLLAILLFGFIAVYFFSDLMAPLLIAIVLAYLLEWPIRFLSDKMKLPYAFSLFLVLGGFIALVFFMVIFLIPNLWNQTLNLLRDLPNMINQFHAWVLSLPENYPELIDYAMIDTIFTASRDKILGFAESVFKFSLTSIMSLVTLGIYAFLVPLMVFFMLKDKTELLESVSKFLPRNRHLASKVWIEMKQQIANYIRGKIIEILIMAVVSYIIFLYFDLRYPLLLAVGVGLSVLVPYIGAVLITIPVVLVAAFQFGITPTFWYILIAYTISQILDGNLLVPFLFSEAVNLHPLTIIIAVLIFGGLWGFWGVFFAIPLATLVKAVINAWPSDEMV